MIRSDVGREQHSSASPASMSRGLMPPAWRISTLPDSTRLLQVPHTPLPQENGSWMPSARAASSTVVEAGQAMLRMRRRFAWVGDEVG